MVLHSIAALAITAAVGLLTGQWSLGASFAIGLFFGREHAQAEYRWIERYGAGRRANMPWYGGFTPKAWTFKGLLDWIVPAIACLILLAAV